MYRLVLLIIAVLLLVGCGGGNSTVVSTSPPLFSSTAVSNEKTTTSSISTATADDNSGTLPVGWDKALLGTWKEISDTAGNPLETCQFDEDGSVACGAANGQDQIGTWSQIDSSHILFTYQGTQAALEYQIVGNKLTFTFSNPQSTQVYEKE